MPKKSDKSKETDAQRQTRCTFRDATLYAKASMRDPALKAYYWRKAQQLKLPNAYTAALTDFLRKGKIESVNRKKYTGKVGGQIEVIARKPGFSVKEVAVTLSTTNGILIEQGPAIKNTQGNWIYKNTVAASNARELVLSVKAIDVNGKAIT